MRSAAHADPHAAMQIDNAFVIPLPPAAAWTILMNVAETAACFPGASEIEADGADRYRGKVTVKLGPAAMIFAGSLTLADRDDDALGARVEANWRETKGRGNALTRTRFALAPDGEGTRVTMQTDLQLAGQVAQYGRGSGMLAELSAVMISKFADNLRVRLEAAQQGDAGSAGQGTNVSGFGLVLQALGNKLKR